jgi:hypothetical protein
MAERTMIAMVAKVVLEANLMVSLPKTLKGHNLPTSPQSDVRYLLLRCQTLGNSPHLLGPSVVLGDGGVG